MIEATSEYKKSLKELVAEYSPVLLMLPFLFFIASYLFNLSYFLMFGIKLWKIPLSSADYIVSVNALGIIIGLVVIYFVIVLLLSLRGIRDKNMDVYIGNDISLQYKNNLKYRKKYLKEFYAIFIFVTLGFAIETYRVQHLFCAVELSFLLLLYVILKLVKYDFYSVSIRFSICFVCALIWAIVFFARAVSVNDYEDMSSIVMIDGKTYCNVRSFDSGFFVREVNTNKMLFITKQDVMLIFSPPVSLIDYINKKGSSPLS